MSSFNVAQDIFTYTLLKECGQTTSECGLSNRISMHLACIHTCTKSCSLVIGPPKTHVNVRSEQGLTSIKSYSLIVW